MPNKGYIPKRTLTCWNFSRSIESVSLDNRDRCGETLHTKLVTNQLIQLKNNSFMMNKKQTTDVAPGAAEEQLVNGKSVVDHHNNEEFSIFSPQIHSTMKENETINASLHLQ